MARGMPCRSVLFASKAACFHVFRRIRRMYSYGSLLKGPTDEKKGDVGKLFMVPSL
jgi:hypothetical protein